MVPWSMFFSGLLFHACLALKGPSGEHLRQRRSLYGSECQHDGVRVDTKSGSICLCPTGYTGNTCQTETEIPAVSTLSEMNVQDGGVIVCELNKVCVLYINVEVANYDAYISNNGSIDITVSLDNFGLKYLKTIGNKINLNFGQLHLLSILTVIESVDGRSGRATFNALQNNESVDSVTYTLEFVEKMSTSSSDFLDSANTPSESRMVCGDFCRLLLVTRRLLNNSCSQVDGLCASTWTFKTIVSAFNCYTEIVFKSSSCQKLCFNVRGTRSTMCYWRLPSIEESASCGCDALCSNATLENVCCPQNRSINVCEVGGVSSAVVIGVSVGTSLSALIALVAVGCFLKLRTNMKKKIDAQSDAPVAVRERPETRG